MKISEIIEAEEFTPLSPYPDPEGRWGPPKPSAKKIRPNPWANPDPHAYSNNPKDSMMGQYYRTRRKTPDGDWSPPVYPRKDSDLSSAFHTELQRNYHKDNPVSYGSGDTIDSGRYMSFTKPELEKKRTRERVI